MNADSRTQVNAVYSVVIGFHLRSMFTADSSGVHFINTERLWLILLLYTFFWLEWLHDSQFFDYDTDKGGAFFRFLVELAALSCLSFAYMFILDSHGDDLVHRNFLETPFFWFNLYLLAVVLWQRVNRATDTPAVDGPPVTPATVLTLLNVAVLTVYTVVYLLILWRAPLSTRALQQSIAVYIGLRWVVTVCRMVWRVAASNGDVEAFLASEHAEGPEASQ